MNDDDLPEEFFEQLDKDFHECDLLIVMGTSLKVEPFPGMIEDPPLNVPRVLINNEQVVTYVEELGEKNGKLVEISKDRWFLGGTCSEVFSTLIVALSLLFYFSYNPLDNYTIF